MKFYTIDEVAEILKVTDKTIRRLIEKKKLNAVIVGTSDDNKKGAYRISEEEFNRYLEENKAF